MKPPEELNRIADVVLNYRHDPKCTTAKLRQKKKAKKTAKKAKG